MLYFVQLIVKTLTLKIKRQQKIHSLGVYMNDLGDSCSSVDIIGTLMIIDVLQKEPSSSVHFCLPSLWVVDLFPAVSVSPHSSIIIFVLQVKRNWDLKVTDSPVTELTNLKSPIFYNTELISISSVEKSLNGKRKDFRDIK